jgi:hypothetical protein
LLLYVPLVAASAVIYTVTTAAMTQTVAAQHTGTAIGLDHASRSACGMVGPVLGGLLFRVRAAPRPRGHLTENSDEHSCESLRFFLEFIKELTEGGFLEATGNTEHCVAPYCCGRRPIESTDAPATTPTRLRFGAGRQKMVLARSTNPQTPAPCVYM